MIEPMNARQLLTYFGLSYEDLKNNKLIKTQVRKKYKATHPDMPQGDQKSFEEAQQWGKWLLGHTQEMIVNLDPETHRVVPNTKQGNIPTHGSDVNDILFR